jgi:glutaconate CoA-transferase, subunit B
MGLTLASVVKAVPLSKEYIMENKPVLPYEMMIGAISRLLINGEFVVTGTLSPIPAAGCLLAKFTHAPDINPMIYGDPANRMSDGLHEFFGLAQKGRVDTFFLSGIQIDQRGSINLSVIGDYMHPKLRLPGGAGSGMLYSLSRRTILFTMSHTKKLFVPKVDFVNATAFDYGVKTAWRLGGLSHVVTPLCVMKFDVMKQCIVLDYVFEGARVEQVVENTGFDLDVSARQIPVLNPLDDESRRVLRGPVLKKMRTIYPLVCQMVWGPDD